MPENAISPESKTHIRVLTGKIAHERRKAAQDEADKPAMQIISAIIVVVVLIGLSLIWVNSGPENFVAWIALPLSPTGRFKPSR